MKLQISKENYITSRNELLAKYNLNKEEYYQEQDID